MKTYAVKEINDDVAIRFDLNIWALPLSVLSWWNPQYGCRDTQIQFLCFAIRFLGRK